MFPLLRFLFGLGFEVIDQGSVKDHELAFELSGSTPRLYITSVHLETCAFLIGVRRLGTHCAKSFVILMSLVRTE